jgi:hypothetical protein
VRIGIVRRIVEAIDWWPEAAEPEEALDQIRALATWAISERYNQADAERVYQLVAANARGGYEFACAFYDMVGWPVGVERPAEMAMEAVHV